MNSWYCLEILFIMQCHFANTFCLERITDSRGSGRLRTKSSVPFAPAPRAVTSSVTVAQYPEISLGMDCQLAHGPSHT